MYIWIGYDASQFQSNGWWRMSSVEDRCRWESIRSKVRYPILGWLFSFFGLYPLASVGNIIPPPDIPLLLSMELHLYGRDSISDIANFKSYSISKLETLFSQIIKVTIQIVTATFITRSSGKNGYAIVLPLLLILSRTKRKDMKLGKTRLFLGNCCWR